MDPPMPAASAASLPQQQPRSQTSQQLQQGAKSQPEPDPLDMLKRGIKEAQQFYRPHQMRWARRCTGLTPT